MIIKVDNKRKLKKFVYFVKDLYKGNTHYIYPLFNVLTKELKREVLKQKNYVAILSVDSNDIVQGRLLYHMEFNHKEKRDVCYFSYFDCINSKQVSKELFERMEADMRENKVTYSEGTFTPYDPDNRRGILVEGFDDDPVIFTSYNMNYLPKLLSNYGYKKKIDTFSVKPEANEKTSKRLNTLAKYFEKRYDIDMDYLDFKHLDRDIEDIHAILDDADNEHIYQETPSIELIKSVAKNLKLFLDRRIIMIARERSTRKPIGFAFCLLDYNQVFKRLKGKLRPIRMLLYKRKITRVRGMMQYVIPKYQGTGLIGYMYKKIFDEFQKMGITDFEAGTMVEGNVKPLQAFSKFGGKVSKVYRIYGKELAK